MGFDPINKDESWTEEGLFKAKAVNEVDAERDRATQTYETRSNDKQLSAVLRVDELLATISPFYCT